ncbi:MAG: hypothetical protein AAFU03_01395 [Bacteroidota bacterium]
MQNPSQFHQVRREEYSSTAAVLRKQYNRLSVGRLIVFVIAVILTILAGTQYWWAGILVAIFSLILFSYGVRKHEAIAQRAKHAENLALLAEAELAGLKHEFSRWNDGRHFLDAQHPYAADLDLFGPHSLFQFLNRSVSAGGEARLANWLLGAQPIEDIKQRQKQVEQLGQEAEWCHEFRARGMELIDDPNYAIRLKNWLQEPPLVADNPLLKVALWVVPFLTLLTIYLLFTLPVWQVGLLGLLPAVLIMRQYNQAITRLHQYTTAVGEALGVYADLVDAIEEADWKTEELQQLQAPFEGKSSASDAIKALQYAVTRLDLRYNAFSALFELSVLYSLRWLLRLDRWRIQYREQLPAWLEGLAEIDALVSLANLRHNRPHWTQPDIHTGAIFSEYTPTTNQAPLVTNMAVTNQPGYFAVSLGHPLLALEKRVTNDFSMKEDGHIHLITGSNMAGKSTWLRTVGINIVLALAGAPVCAKVFALPHLQLWTSMRTQDALHESTSSFFAELKRLRDVIDAVEKASQPCFFLLDEILKGTNSRDRHTGARALIRQLIHAKGSGLIATHDLELTEMEQEPGSRVENYAMEVELEDGKLVFDYKLKRGASKSFNATLLMAQMGISIDEKDINLRHE